MNRHTIILISSLILVSMLACGVMPLPRTPPARFDYHDYLTPYPTITTATPQALPEAGGKVREWQP